jgi:hypothetical protein
MPGIQFDGLDDLIGDLEKLADLPDEVMDGMVNAEADVVVKAHKKELEARGMRQTGQLINSVGKTGVTTKGYSHAVDVYPQGTRDDGVRNAEVGFILEYGSPKKHIPASNWMAQANEGCADEAVKAAGAVYDEFLKKHNL